MAATFTNVNAPEDGEYILTLYIRKRSKVAKHLELDINGGKHYDIDLPETNIHPLGKHHLVVELKKFYILCTHLSLKEAQRVESVAIIKDVVSKLKNKPVFIAGDMNARPGTPVMNAFKEFATVLSNENKKTAPSYDPRGCIDYVLGTNGSFKVLGEEVIYGCFASDHLPLYVDVKVSKAKNMKNKR